MLIREATAADWPAIWPILRAIAAAGETLTWDREVSEEYVRTIWLQPPPSRTVVALDAAGAVLGTAKMQPNQGGAGAHVANASFMVDPGRSGQGVGRALGEYVLARAKADGYRAMVFNAVVETNTRAVALWQSLGLRILATIPAAFQHPTHGSVGLHIMHRTL